MGQESYSKILVYSQFTEMHDSESIPLTVVPRYIVVIDSGSSGSRIYVYKTPAGNGSNLTSRNLGVRKIFGPSQSNAQVDNCSGGKLQPFPSPIRIFIWT